MRTRLVCVLLSVALAMLPGVASAASVWHSIPRDARDSLVYPPAGLYSVGVPPQKSQDIHRQIHGAVPDEGLCVWSSSGSSADYLTTVQDTSSANAYALGWVTYGIVMHDDDQSGGGDGNRCWGIETDEVTPFWWDLGSADIYGGGFWSPANVWVGGDYTPNQLMVNPSISTGGYETTVNVPPIEPEPYLPAVTAWVVFAKRAVPGSPAVQQYVSRGQTLVSKDPNAGTAFAFESVVDTLTAPAAELTLRLTEPHSRVHSRWDSDTSQWTAVPWWYSANDVRIADDGWVAGGFTNDTETVQALWSDIVSVEASDSSLASDYASFDFESTGTPIGGSSVDGSSTASDWERWLNETIAPMTAWLWPLEKVGDLE